MRRYDDPVEVRRGWVTQAGGPDGQEGPEQFRWRGRQWRVRAVIAQWVETAPWWTGPQERASADLLEERELWRVEASRGRESGGESGPSGVFDLSFDWSDASWRLVGCVD